MEIGPILATLRRHKTAAGLIVLQVALTCAIVCNALFLIGNRLERMHRPSGVSESEVVRVQLAGIGRDENAAALTRSDLAVLRGLPGVKAATVVNQNPHDQSSWNNSVGLVPAQQTPTLTATMYMGEDQFFDTMGLAITEGRGFNTDEYIEWADTNGPAARLPSVAVITRSMAQAMFPDGKALGRNFYGLGDDNPVRIVGIVDHLVRPNEFGGDAGHEYSMVFPVRIPYTVGGRYLLRTDPARRAEVLEAAAAALTRNNPNRIVLSQRTFEEMRANYYKQDRIMAWLLVSVIVALLVVTALGIVGLASFWVQQRTRQIGVRRALGATRAQILRYFQTENFLLVSIGLVLGMMFAFGLNQFLMAKAELPRLPLYYLPFGALALWLLGQIAVFWPARRAAAVPPAIATRSA